MTETRQRRHKNRLRSADRPRLQAHLLASTEPPETVKKAMVQDVRDLERENMRLRATLRTIANAPEVEEERKGAAYDEWRVFARKQMEALRAA